MTTDSARVALLRATGQEKVLVRGGVAFLVASALLFCLQYFSAAFTLLSIAAVMGLIPVAGVAYATSAVRCPQCNLAWVRWAISQRPHNDWLAWLYRFTACPNCGLEVHSRSVHLGRDAKFYQIRAVKTAIEESKK